MKKKKKLPLKVGDIQCEVSKSNLIKLAKSNTLIGSLGPYFKRLNSQASNHEYGT